MALSPIAYTIPQYDEEEYANWWMKAYEQGTVNPKVIATDSTGVTTASKIQLDQEGFPITASGARFIPHIDGYYDLWLIPTEEEADENFTINAIQLADNINSDPDKNKTSYHYDTLAEMVADVDDHEIGYRFPLKERTMGKGGGATWYAIDATTSPGNAPNGFDIVAGNAVISYQLGDTGDKVYVSQLWDGGANAAGAFHAARDLAGVDKIIYGDQLYTVDEPVYLPEAYKLDGLFTLKANVGFTGKTLDVAAGGTIVVDALLIYLLGDYNDIAGAQREYAYIGNKITLDCNDAIKTGIYIERMPYSYIGCEVQKAIVGGNSIDVGPYCWGSMLDHNIIENFLGNGISLGVASNGVTVETPAIWGDTKTGVNGIIIADNGNSNGILISGGFIEKVATGTYVGLDNGPTNITGVDYEVCTTNIYALGDLTDPVGRFVGPVTVNNCYLDATGDKILSDNAKVIVDGCRLRTGTDFRTSGTGLIVSRTNEFENSSPSIAGTLNVITEEEQAWTPTLQDDSLSDAEGQTYATTTKGRFVRDGKKVFAKGRITLTSLGTLTGSNTARIAGLPFTPSNSADTQSAISIGYANGLSLPAIASIGGYAGVNQAYITLQKFSATTGSTNLLISELTAAVDIIFSVEYTID